MEQRTQTRSSKFTALTGKLRKGMVFSGHLAGGYLQQLSTLNCFLCMQHIALRGPILGNTEGQARWVSEHPDEGC